MMQPKELTFDGILTKRLFSIPEYQRHYSWQDKQRKDLFSDIKDALKNDEQHYMATIVCKKCGKITIGTDDYEKFDIVDGQQRITTLVLLLKAISKIIKNENPSETEKIQEILTKDDGTSIVLQTNHSNEILRNYLRLGTIPTEASLQTNAEKNMRNAFLECEQFVSDIDNPIKLLKKVKNGLNFIFHTLQENQENMVYTVFEVLNSRGLDVDWLDKTKSLLMGIAYKEFGANSSQIIEIKQSWEAIYRILSQKNIPGHEIVRFTATLNSKDEFSRALSSEKTLEFFKAACEDDPKKAVELSYSIKEITTSLHELYKDRRREAVTNIAHARLLALSIMKYVDKKIKSEILKEWEKVTFIIFGLSSKDSRHKVGEFTRLACEISNNKDLSKNKDTLLVRIRDLVDGKGKDAFKIEKILEEEIKGENCYEGWESELRYFLYRYEEYLAAERGDKIDVATWERIWEKSPKDSIEHIFPQNENISNGWDKDFDDGDREELLHNIGNLILVPPDVNSRLGDKSFKDKKKIYENQNLRMVREVADMQKWTSKEIRKREKKILDWAKTVWI